MFLRLLVMRLIKQPYLRHFPWWPLDKMPFCYLLSGGINVEQLLNLGISTS